MTTIEPDVRDLEDGGYVISFLGLEFTVNDLMDYRALRTGLWCVSHLKIKGELDDDVQITY